MQSLWYIVTDRGGRDRSYPVLVEIEVEKVSSNLYERAKWEAARESPEIRSCGTDVSAFRLSVVQLKTWKELERRILQASQPPENVEGR